MSNNIDYLSYNNLSKIFLETINPENGFKTPLENPFIQHLFFDGYIEEGSGNNNVLVANIFEKLNSIYLKINNKNLSIKEKEFFEKINNLLKRSINIFNQFTNVQDDNLTVLENIFKEIKRNEDTLLLGGWYANESAHAISFYIENKGITNNNKNIFDISIFNSGNGYNKYHIIDGKKTIGIKYKDVNEEQLTILIKLIQFCVIKNTNHFEKDIYLEALKKFYDFSGINLSGKSWKYVNMVLQNIKGMSDGLNQSRMSFNDFYDNHKEQIDKFLEKSKLEFKNLNNYFLKNKKDRNEILSIVISSIDYFYNIQLSLYIPLSKDGKLMDFVDFFYLRLNLIFKDIQPIAIFDDMQQLSGSCSFFSLYYFTKYMILKNINFDLYENYTVFLKKTTIKYIFDTINHFYQLKINNKSLNMKPCQEKIFYSMFYILFKDYGNLIDIKTKDNFIEKVNYLIANIPKETIFSNEEFKDLKKTELLDLINNYIKIKNKYLDFLNTNDDNLIFILNLDDLKLFLNENLYDNKWSKYKYGLYCDNSNYTFDSKLKKKVLNKEDYKIYVFKDFALMDLFDVIFKIINKNKKYLVKIDEFKKYEKSFDYIFLNKNNSYEDAKNKFNKNKLTENKENANRENANRENANRENANRENEYQENGYQENGYQENEYQENEYQENEYQENENENQEYEHNHMEKININDYFDINYIKNNKNEVIELKKQNIIYKSYLPRLFDSLANYKGFNLIFLFIILKSIIVDVLSYKNSDDFKKIDFDNDTIKNYVLDTIIYNLGLTNNKSEYNLQSFLLFTVYKLNINDFFNTFLKNKELFNYFSINRSPYGGLVVNNYSLLSFLDFKNNIPTKIKNYYERLKSDPESIGSEIYSNDKFYKEILDNLNDGIVSYRNQGVKKIKKKLSFDNIVNIINNNSLENYIDNLSKDNNNLFYFFNNNITILSYLLNKLNEKYSKTLIKIKDDNKIKNIGFNNFSIKDLVTNVDNYINNYYTIIPTFNGDNDIFNLNDNLINYFDIFKKLNIDLFIKQFKNFYKINTSLCILFTILLNYFNPEIKLYENEEFKNIISDTTFNLLVEDNYWNLNFFNDFYSKDIRKKNYIEQIQKEGFILLKQETNNLEALAIFLKNRFKFNENNTLLSKFILNKYLENFNELSIYNKNDDLNNNNNNFYKPSYNNYYGGYNIKKGGSKEENEDEDKNEKELKNIFEKEEILKKYKKYYIFKNEKLENFEYDYNNLYINKDSINLNNTDALYFYQYKNKNDTESYKLKLKIKNNKIFYNEDYLEKDTYVLSESESLKIFENNLLVNFILSNNLKYFYFKNINDDSQSIILLIGFTNYIFLLKNNNNKLNTTLFDIYEHKTFDIISDRKIISENILLNQNVSYMQNALLLKDNNFNYKLLMFMNKFIMINYLNERLRYKKISYTKIKDEKFIKEEYIEKDKDYYTTSFYLEFNNPYLNPKEIDSEKICIYLLSQLLSYNYLPLYNIDYLLDNINDNLKKEEIKNSNIIKIYTNLFMELKNRSYFNYPLWVIFVENYNKEDSQIRKIFNNRQNIVDLKNINIKKDELDDNIQEISDLVDNFFMKINKINSSSLSKIKQLSNINNELVEFYNSIRFYCKKNKLKNHINSTFESNNKNLKNLILENYDEIDIMLKQLYDLLFKTYQRDIFNNTYINEVVQIKIKKGYSRILNIGALYNLNNLLLLSRKYLYNIIFMKNIFFIIKELKQALFFKNNNNKIQRKNEETCLMLGEIYKNIDLNYILSRNSLLREKKEKEIYQIIFELESGNYIRIIQNDFLNKVYNNINENKFEIAYQLLMGMGKTTTITPLIILKEFYEKNNNKFTIIVPEHLVNFSFEIMIPFTSYIQLFLYKIITIDESLYCEDCINIISDTTIKWSLLNNIQNSENNNLKELLNDYMDQEQLVIMDEIDSMIDPIKSNLNITSDEKREHKYVNIIFNSLFDLIVQNYKNNEYNINKYLENILSSNVFNVNNKPSNKKIIDNMKIKIKDTIDLIFNWNLNQQYGFLNYNKNELFEIDLTNMNYFSCIPFEKIDKPIIGSKFTDFELYLSVTILGYIKLWEKENMRLLDIYNYITNIYSFIYEIQESTTIDINLLIKLIYPVFYKIFGDESKEIIKYYDENKKNKKLINYLENLLEKYKLNISKHLIELVYDYFSKFILNKFFKIENKHWNISFIDIIGIINKKIMFSGTPYFPLPYNAINNMFESNIPFDKFNIRKNLLKNNNNNNNELEFIGGSNNNLNLKMRKYRYKNVLNNLKNKVKNINLNKLKKQDLLYANIIKPVINLNKIENNKYFFNNYSNYRFKVRNENRNNQKPLNEENQLLIEKYRNVKQNKTLNNENNNKTNQNQNFVPNNNNFALSLINQIVKDKYSQGSIKSSFLGLLNVEKPKILTCNTKTNNLKVYNYNININNQKYIEKLSKLYEVNILNYLFNQNEILNYQAIIDVAGLILETSKKTIVNMIFDIFKGKKKVLYVNEESIRMVKISKDIDIPYKNELYKQDEIFIYYDQKNTVGVDFKQPIYMKGLVLLNLNDKITDVAQGIFRLRKMNITHTIDFYLPYNDYEILRENVIDNNNEKLNMKLLLKLYNKLNHNGDKNIKDSMSLIQIQIIKYLYRMVENKNSLYEETIDYILEMKDDDKLFYEKLIEEFRKKLNITQNINIEFNEKIMLESKTFVREEEQSKEKNVQKQKEKEKLKERNVSLGVNNKENYHYILLPKLLNVQFMKGLIDPYSLYKERDNGNFNINFIKEHNIQNLINRNLISNIKPTKDNLLRLQLLKQYLYLSSNILDSINDKLLLPTLIYFVQYRNDDGKFKNIFISDEELYGFTSRFRLFEKYYLIKNNNNNKKNNSKLAVVHSYFDNTKVSILKDLFSRFSIYDMNGIQIYPVLDFNPSFNGINRLFIDLLYLVFFYKKMRMNDIYRLLNSIPQESKENVLFLMKTMEKYYQLKNPNFDISGANITDLNQLENDNILLKFFNLSGFNFGKRDFKDKIINYVKTGNF